MGSKDDVFDTDGFLYEVRMYRERYGLSESDISILATGYPSGSSNQVLRGERGLSLLMACRLAILCDISIDKFVRY